MTSKLVIVGGGSSGWITAAYLNAALNAQPGPRRVDVTLVESPDVPRISVGEATVPSIHHVLKVIGLDEAEFMRATDATFKQSIKYVNWLEKSGTAYHHPFSRYTPGPIDRTGPVWNASARDIPFIETVSAQPVISDLLRGPKTMDDRPFVSPLKYAYHFDAQLFADYLQRIATQRGVIHVRANLTHACKAENGHITSVHLDTGEQIQGDLFVDCTGFKSLLIEGEMDVPWEDFSQWLFCNRAVVTQYDYDRHFPGYIRPFTTATAQSAGWIWDTPTQTRRATGYVYSSDFISDEEAHRELLAYQGSAGGDQNTRVIHFRSGQRQKLWTKNCIAVGLAGGFVEPLESTGIYLSELGAVLLAEHFPEGGDDMADMAFRYNRIMSNRYYEILDFINMHYCLSRRDDTQFWRTVREAAHITDRLQAKLAYWAKKPPSRSDFEDQSFLGFHYAPRPQDDPEIDPRPPVDTAALWNYASYEAILYGMDFLGGQTAGPGDTRARSQVPSFIIDAIRAADRQLPPHHVWLHKRLGMPAWPQGDTPAAWRQGVHA